MTDEIKTEEKECKCFCRSEGVRKFVIIALGTFVGVYCALSLFAALHRPPMMGRCHFNPYMGPRHHHEQQFKGMHPGDFQRPMLKPGVNNVQPPAGKAERAPFEMPRK